MKVKTFPRNRGLFHDDITLEDYEILVNDFMSKVKVIDIKVTLKFGRFIYTVLYEDKE